MTIEKKEPENREKPVLYVSGPMRGKPRLNWVAFQEAEREMRRLGWDVVTPFTWETEDEALAIAEDEEKTRASLSRDLAFLCGGIPPGPPEKVVLLDGWEKSKGAQAEWAVARALGIPTLAYRDYEEGYLPAENELGPEPEPPGGIPAAMGGRMETFETGAKRERKEGKGRFDLLSPAAIRVYAEVMERGVPAHGDRNWEKGMTITSFLDSGLRHIFKALDGQTGEDHLGAALWNLGSAVHVREHVQEGRLPANLDDLPKRE